MKNNLFLKWLILAIFFVVVSACTDTKAISMARPTVTIVPTTSKTPPPDVTQPTATSIPEMTSWANEACWEKKPLEVAGANLLGSLLYQDFQSKEYRLLDLVTRNSRGVNLFGNFFTQIQVSPYGQYFSILRSENNELILFSEHGGKIYSIPPKTYFSQFLSDSRILLGYVDTSDDLYVLNPESEEVKPITVSKPHMLGKDCWDGGLKCNYRYSAFSPDLRYVFYVSDSDNSNLLLDIGSGKLVENKAGGNLFGQAFFFPDKPVWKLDSSAVTIFDSRNYYNIGIDGEYTQLTHLENLLSNYSLMEGKWSPTGRYLAFMARVGGNVSLFVFDSYSNVLINPCLSEVFYGYRHYWTISWSPTSDVLAIDIGGKARFVNDPPGSDGYRTVIEEWPTTFIVDVVQQEIYQVPNTIRNEQQETLGWLNWELP